MMKQKHLFTFILTFLFLTSVLGQGWESTFGGDSSIDQGRSVVQTPDGGFAIAGGTINGSAWVYKVNVDGQMNGAVGFGTVGETTIIESMQLVGDELIVVGTDGDDDPFFNIVTPNLSNAPGPNLSASQISNPQVIRHTSDDNFILGGSFAFNKGVVIKMDETGNIIWRKEISEDGDDISVVYAIEETSDGGYIVSGMRQIDIWSMYITKLDVDGNTEWENFYNTGRLGTGNTVAQTPDGGYILAGSKKLGTPPNFSDNIRLIKISATGNTEWDRDYGAIDAFDDVANGVQVTADGGFIVTGFIDQVPMLMKTDDAGELIWQKKYENAAEGGTGIHVQVLNDGYIFAGTAGSLFMPETNDMLLVRTDLEGVSFSNFITGNVWSDEIENCELDTDELPMEDWIVQAVGTDNTFSGTTDEEGNYSIGVPPGEYTARLTPPSTYWNPCANDVPVNLSEFGENFTIDFAAQSVIDCPFMTVDMTTPFLRRCFESFYTVNYCNQGTIPAEDAYIEITFDEYTHVLGSELPWESQTDSLFVFEIGDIAIGECGSFTINIETDCDSTVLGQTHCTSAHIFPDTICTPISALWDESDIIVNGYCEGDSLHFEIKNIGVGNTSAPLQYTIIEDHIILVHEEYSLQTSESLTITLPVNGSAFRLATEQSEGHPIGNMPAVTIEGCSDGNDFSIGFTNLFPDGDDAPFISIDCQQNIGSYDPNDKQAFPRGYGENHFIEANTDLEYLIRFQNTGTDTAFTVVVEDDISTFLDVTTIVPGASSHPYDFQIINERRVRFVFDDILLPDSTTNLLGSNGFVKFKIKQQLNNPIGTIIENSAGIYFDFNEPVITNTVFHEIGEDFIESNIVIATEEVQIDDVKVTAYPNPFDQFTNFKVANLEFQQLEFQLYQANGQLVRQEFHESSTFRFERKNLLSGMYFYQLSSNGQRIYSGKMIMK